MIQRIFHPVGQGAFYSERHENHNIVYDCGSMNVSKGKKVVSQSFSKDDIIDILFISHFDYDHVSLIEDLKTTVKEIRNVVIPLLHRNEKILLSNVFKALGEYSLASLVDNPNKFFGAETRIISVQVYKKKINSEKGETTNIKTINLTDIKQNRKIPSGTPITIENYSDWVFIPFNYKYKDRNKEFLDNLKDDEIEKLKSSEHIFDLEFRNKIKTVYKEINGNINENSMFLYSGPTEKNLTFQDLYWENHIFNNFPCYFFSSIFGISKKVGCLYTGDGKLNFVDEEKIYEKYWDLIGTIQIPHHGSLASFDNKILKDNKFICPFSVGKDNPYGHPSIKVISEILSHKSYPIYVTEDIDSIFIEIIEKNKE